MSSSFTCTRFSIAVITLLFLFYTTSISHSRNAPYKNGDIIDVDRGQISTGEVLKKDFLPLDNVSLFTDASFRNAKILSRVEAPFYLNVDRFQAQAYINYPITVAPGTNGFTPEIRLKISNVKNGSSLTDELVAGDVIASCSGLSGLCLGEDQLVEVEVSGSDRTYTLKTDPRVNITKTPIGFVLINGEGLKQFYETITADDGSRIHRLRFSIDWFENHIFYEYDLDTGALSTIRYGQDKVLFSHQRTIHFRYGNEKPGLLTQIESRISGRVVRVYQIGRNQKNQVITLQECAPQTEGTLKLSCFSPTRFGWIADNSGGEAILRSVQNGKGAETVVQYTLSNNDPVLKTLILYEDGKKVGQTDYAFSQPIIDNGAIVGYSKSWSQATGQPIGEYKQYGQGILSGMLVAEGMFQNDAHEELRATDYPLISKSEYVRGGKDADGAELPVFLNRKIQTVFGENGIVQTQSETTYRYDNRNRIKRIVTPESKEVFTYLGEKNADHFDKDTGNLVVDKSIFNLKLGKLSQRRVWEYSFSGSRLTGSKSRIEKNGEILDDLTTKQLLDEHGNIVETVTRDKKTKFGFDPLYKTYPVNAEVVVVGQKSSIDWQYDAASGKQVMEKFEDGSQVWTELNELGQTTDVTTILTDPKKASSGEPSGDVETKEATRITDLGDGRIRMTKVIEKAAVHTNNAEVLKFVTVTDGLGRVVNINGEARDKHGVLLRESSLENEYTSIGQTTTVIDETGRVQKTRFDQLGRVVSEETEGYGATEFLYNADNLVSQIIRNGKTIGLAYDERARLVSKKLPDGFEYSYEYDVRHPTKVSRTVLPSKKVIEYTFTDEGKPSEKRVIIPDVIGDDVEFVTSFEYQNGQLSKVTYPDTSEVYYQYEGSRLENIRWGNNPPKEWKSANIPIASYQSDFLKSGDAVLVKELGNGILEKYRWTKNGNLHSIDFERNGNVAENNGSIASLFYEFTEDANLLKNETRKDALRNGIHTSETRYLYDENGRLVESTDSHNNNAVAATNFSILNRQLDSVDEKIQLHRVPVELTFDQNANITGMKTRDRDVTFDFDVENHLLASSVRTDRSTRNFTYEYDHTGQRIEKDELDGAVTYYIDEFYEITVLPDGTMQQTRYVWDHMGRIAAFTDRVTDEDLEIFATVVPTAISDETGGGVAAGLKYVSTASAQISKFLSPVTGHALLPLLIFFGIALTLISVFERATGSARMTIVARPDFVLGRIRRVSLALVTFVFTTMIITPSVHAALEGGDGSPKVDQVTFYHHDIRGSVIAVSGEDGQQSASVGYTPYGAMSDDQLSAGNNNFRFKFAGMEFDEETQLYYDIARYYSPELGRFLSPDPARSTKNPYAYTNGDPVNYIDPDGRMMLPVHMAAMHRAVVTQPSRQTVPTTDVEAQVDNDGGSWFRYPSFWNWTFKKSHDFVTSGEDEEGAARPAADPTDEDRAAYDRLARSDYMQSYTRMGGYLQSVFGAALLAWLAPTSYQYEDGSEISAGFGVDLAVYFLTVTAFSAYGKGYTANESEYWNGIKARSANGADYVRLAARRMLWKVGVQITAFTGIKLLASVASGYPLFEGATSTDAVLSSLGLLVARYLVYSIGGNSALLPYYLMTKEPKGGYDDTMTAEKLNAMPWWKRWVVKASIWYRGYTSRKGFWAEKSEAGTLKRYRQNLWYPSYVLQMYGLYMLSSLGYYGGLASIMPAIPSLNEDVFFSAWRSNLILIILAPAASPLAALNYWRKSFTIVKKRAANNPRTSGLWFRLLGPIEGLRLAKYDDRAYLPDDTWMQILRENSGSAVADLEMQSQEEDLSDDGGEPLGNSSQEIEEGKEAGQVDPRSIVSE